MGHTELKAGHDGGARELAREHAAFGAWVGIDGALRSGYVPLVPVPPWGVAYDVWAMGPPIDVVQDSQGMHACMAVSLPLLARYIGCQ
eukprot:1303992-Alexandrium_andersonii.AAC.1